MTQTAVINISGDERSNKGSVKDNFFLSPEPSYNCFIVNLVSAWSVYTGFSRRFDVVYLKRMVSLPESQTSFFDLRQSIEIADVIVLNYWWSAHRC